VPHLRDTQPLPAEVRPHLRALLSPAGIVKAGMRVTVGDEYLPRGADPKVWKAKPAGANPVVGADRPLDLRILRARGTEIRLETRSGAANRIRIGRWCFPGWTLTVNGKARPVRPNPVGSIDVEIPAGTATVRLEMHTPGIRRLGLWISALGLVLLALLAGLGIRGRIPYLD